jgi:hypothetical protein
MWSGEFRTILDPDGNMQSVLMINRHGQRRGLGVNIPQAIQLRVVVDVDRPLLQQNGVDKTPQRYFRMIHFNCYVYIRMCEFSVCVTSSWNERSHTKMAATRSYTSLEEFAVNFVRKHANSAVTTPLTIFRCKRLHCEWMLSRGRRYLQR